MAETSRVGVRLLVGVILAGTLSVLDSTLVVPLLGVIGRDLGGGASVSWLVSAYLLASTVTIPLWGRWLDLRGERSPMWWALGLFTLGTAFAVVAPSLEILILARVIQGIGAGGVFPLGQAILTGRCTPDERARLQIYYNIAYGIAAGLGPVVGGALAHVSWRLSFVVILPFCAIVAVSLLGQLRSEPATTSVRPFDPRGSILITVALTSILLGVEREWWILIGVGLVLLALFVRHSRRMPHGLVPMSVLSSRTILSCAAVGLVIGFVQFAYLTYLPLFSSQVDDTMNSGLVVIPLTIAWTTLGAFSMVIAVRRGSRRLIVLGLLLNALAGVLLAVWFELPAMFIASGMVGVATGLALMPALLLSQRTSVPEDLGATTSFYILVRNFGGALGAAVTAVALLGLGTTPTLVMLSLVAIAGLIPAFLLPSARTELALRASED